MNILILGTPNVGKTSIYNIISNNTNIIHKTTGTTRDWHVSSLKTNKYINIYDTPGIIFDNKRPINEIYKNLISNIDIFLYVIDYKNVNYLNDKELLNSIRKYKKDIILLVNKDDNCEQNKDLQFLGVEDIYFISCSHKLGFDNFLSHFNKLNIKKDTDRKNDFSISLFGKTNVGKSTLLNRLVGYNRSMVSDIPKTTTDIVSASYMHKGYKYLIKDTAGLIKKNKIDKNSLDYYSVKNTLSIIKDIDLSLFLIDITQGFDNQSKKIFKLIFKESNVILFIINKIDLIKLNRKNYLSQLKKDIESDFSQSKNIHIIAISAYNKRDINKVKQYIHKLIKDLNKSLTTIGNI